MLRRSARAFCLAMACLMCVMLLGCSQEAIDQMLVQSATLPPSAAQTEDAVAPTPEVLEAAPAVTEEQAPMPVEPTASPTPDPPSLSQGDESEEVRRLQERLIELGYLEGEATGYFGTQTEAAVRAFQDMFGLQVDGSAGPLTQEILFSQEAEAIRPTAPASAPPTDLSALPLSGITIGLDPGHQGRGNNEHEPIAPGSSDTKPKVSSGTEGVSTHVPEYVVNLEVGLRLRDLLEAQGANVVMSRETHDVNISNAERAQLFNDAGVDLAVRLHCDGEDDHSRNGAFVLVPVGRYVEGIEAASRSAAQCVLDAFVAATGANNLGLSERDDQTGFNWSTVPVINIEMGHMSNPDEDNRLVSSDYQDLCAQGIAQGIVNYFT